MHYRSSTPDFDRTIEGFHTGEHLANARKQADARKLDEVLIVDVDCHHYETDNFAEILEYIEDPVIRQTAINTFAYKGPSAVLMDQPGYQDVGGRVSRYMERKHEVIPKTAQPREVEQTLRWMNALSVDYACLFPTPMLFMGLHPQHEVEVALARAYNRWLTDTVLPSNPRVRSMLYLPFNDPEATYQMVKEYGHKPGVIGFMVVSTRYKPVYDNAFMKTYALLEELGSAAVVSCVVSLERPVGLDDQSLHHRACGRLYVLQRRSLRELDRQRSARAISETESDLDRVGSRLDSLADAAARQ